MSVKKGRDEREEGGRDHTQEGWKEGEEEEEEIPEGGRMNIKGVSGRNI